MKTFFTRSLAAAIFIAAGVPAFAQETINLGAAAPAGGTHWSYSSGVFTILNGASVTVTGTAIENRRVVVAENATATVTLNNAAIDLSALGGGGSSTEQNCTFLLRNGAKVMMTLAGSNQLRSGHRFAGLQVATGTEIEISGSGSLIASCAEWGGTGIGGSREQSGGKITIGGDVTIEAIGYGGASGINGDITINSGSVTATGHYGAGIGNNNGSLVVNGGTLTTNCTAGCSYPMIRCSSVTIIGGSVTASSISPQPTNGFVPVYRTVFAVSGLGSNTIVDIIADRADRGPYGLKDVKADGDGKLYFYFPVGTNTVAVKDNEGNIYSPNGNNSTFDVADNNSTTVTLSKGSSTWPTLKPLTLTAKKDGSIWDGHGKTFFLRSGTREIRRCTDSGDGTVTFLTTDVLSPDGEWEIYDSGKNTGQTFVPSSSEEIDYYSVNYSVEDLDNTLSTLKASWDDVYIPSGGGVPAGKTLVFTATGSSNLAKKNVFTSVWTGTHNGAGLQKTTNELLVGESVTFEVPSVAGPVNMNCKITGIYYDDNTININTGHSEEHGVTFTDGWRFENDVLTILANGTYTVQGAGQIARRIFVSENLTGVNITLKDVNLQVTTSYSCAFEISNNSTVNLTLEGTNTLRSGQYKTGLEVAQGATLVFTKESTGSLTATGGYDGAGIGGGYQGYGGNLTINGGTVMANGGDYGAGIGGGAYGGSGGTITINGGTVTASGGGFGAGIGGGYEGSGCNIAINGGTVIATAGYWAAGIGGGGTYANNDASAITVTITGGTITATGGDSGAGIGGGRGKNNQGAVTIIGGSVKMSNNGGPQPRNAVGTSVYRTEITISELGDNTIVDIIADKGQYGLKDVKADSDSKLYFYLPASTNKVAVKDNEGNVYSPGGNDGTFNVASNNTNNTVTLSAGSSTWPTLNSLTPLTVNKDGSIWNDHGKTFFLKNGTREIRRCTDNGGGTVTFLTTDNISLSEEWDIYDSWTGSWRNTGRKFVSESGGTIDYYSVEYSAVTSANTLNSTLLASCDDVRIPSEGDILAGKTLVFTATGKTDLAEKNVFVTVWTGTHNGSALPETTNESPIWGSDIFEIPSVAGPVVMECNFGNTLYYYDDNIINMNTGLSEPNRTMFNTGWRFENDVLTITANGTYTIKGTGQIARRIFVSENLTGVNITLKDVNLQVTTDYSCAFEIGNGSTVNLTLEGTNTLTSGRYKAGLQAPSSSTLNITAESTGSLTANGGITGAGIGGGDYGDGGTVTINGGTVTANGGTSGAGIGGGRYSDGGTVTITGGTVTANCGYLANAGIGGGLGQSATGTVTITGGSVNMNNNNGPQPQNAAGTSVYLNTLQIGNPAVSDVSVTTGVIGNTVCSEVPSAGSYGIRDVKTDGEGQVYFYLPATDGDETVMLGADGAYYSESYDRIADNTNDTTLLPVTSVLIFKLGGITQAPHDFGSRIYGYESDDLPPELNITVHNTGDIETGALTVTGTDGGSRFTLSTDETGSIASSGSTSFTVRPKTEIAAGEYTDTVRVTAGGISAPFAVRFTVDKKDITVSGGTVTKFYDGNTDATVTGLTFIGPITADEPFESYTVSASYADKNADNGIAVTATVTLQGDASTNYNLTNGTSYPLTGDITQREIRISGGKVKTKDYDGTFVAEIESLEFDALQDGETFVFGAAGDYTATGAAFASADVADNIPVTVTGVSLTSSDKAKNYKLMNGTPSYSDNLKGNIRRATLTSAHLDYDLLTGTVFYDGQPHGIYDPELQTASTPYTGLGTVTVKYESADYPLSAILPVNAGSYTVKITATESSNFNDATDLELTDGTFDIGKIDPTVRHLAFDLDTVDYNGAEHPIDVTPRSDNDGGIGSFPVSYDGMGNITVKYDGNDATPVNAKTYAVTVEITDGTNFNASNEILLGYFTVNQKNITISGGDVAAKTYDGTTGATVTGVTFDVLENGENLEIDIDYEVTAAAFLNPNAGSGNRTVQMTVALKNTDKANNYNLTNGTDWSLVNQSITPATLTVTPDGGQTKVYGDKDPAFTFTTAGWQNDEKKDSASIITGVLIRDAGNDVGEYGIKQGRLSAGSNYDVNFTDGVTFEITKATLTVTPTVGQTKVYGEDDPLPFTFAVSDWQYLDQDDSASIITGTLIREEGDSVRAYTITQGRLSAGGNYNVNFTEGVTFAITPATLTVTPTVWQTKVYGEDDPLPFTFTTDGWKNREAETLLTGVLSRDAGDNVGEYDIKQGDLSAGNNYDVNFTDNVTFAITPATLTVTPNGRQAKVYGENDPLPFTFTTDGWKNRETEALLTGALSRDAGDNVRTYAITQGDLSAGSNYNVSFTESVTFEITPAVLTVTPDGGQTKVYGEADPTAFTFTTVGWQYGEDEDLLTGALNRNVGNDVGPYAITQGDLLETSGNYTIDFAADATFAITKATPTAAHLYFDLSVVSYDGAAHPVAVTPGRSYAGMGAITVKYDGDTTAPVNANTCAVTATIADGDNFSAIADLSLGNFTIAPARQEISFAPAESLLVESGFYLLSAAVSASGGAPPLPPLFRSSNEAVAEVSGDTLWLKQLGTVTVTAYVAPNGNYESAGEVSRDVALLTERLDFDTYVAVKLRCVMIYNNRQLGEDGYTVDAFRWYGNGELLATGSTYALGAAWMAFSPDVVYHFEIDLPDGRTIRSTDKQFDFSTGVAGVEGSNRLLLYPNPLPQGATLNVHTGAWGAGERELLIYSAAGNLVLRQRFSGAFITLPLAAPAGIYFLRVGGMSGKIAVK
jgi:hypothetical protein